MWAARELQLVNRHWTQADQWLMDFLDSILTDVKTCNTEKPKTDYVFKRPGAQFQDENTANKKFKSSTPQKVTSSQSTKPNTPTPTKVTAILKNPNRDVSPNSAGRSKESDEKILNVMHKLFGVPEPISM